MGAIILALIIPFLVLTTRGFAYLGIALSFGGLACFIFSAKRVKKPADWLLFGSILILASCIVLRANPLLTFFNIVALLFLGSIFSLQDEKKTLLNTKLAPLRLFFHLLRLRLKPPTGFTEGRMRRILHSTEQLLSIILTIAILLVIIPLLSAANPFFNSLVQSLLHTFRLNTLLDYLFGENPVVLIARLILAGFLVLVLPRLETFVRDRHQAPMIDPGSYVFQMLLPKIAVALVILIFFVTQIQMYTADTALLQTLGYTHSQLTREVFGHLAVVSLIIFFLIYTDHSEKKWNARLSYILLAEGIFLTLMALKSDVDYSAMFGFTFKRLYGFAIVFWIIGTYAGFAYTYLQKISTSHFVHGIILWTAAVLIGINVMNFDALIAHRFSARTGEGKDYRYIAWNISADASADTQLLAEMTTADDTAVVKKGYEQNIWGLIHRGNTLKEKYEHLDWRTFNLSEYRLYQQIRDVDYGRIERYLMR